MADPEPEQSDTTRRLDEPLDPESPADVLVTAADAWSVGLSGENIEEQAEDAVEGTDRAGDQTPARER